MTFVAEPQTRELSHEDIERVFKSIDIPPCPAIVVEVLAEAQRDEPNLNRLAKSIAADAGMVAIALKLANSPLFRAGGALTDVRQALDRIGTRNIVCVVIATALRASMSGVPPSFIEKFWARTTSIALAAGLVARRQFGVSPDAAYTYALFHNAGVPLMVRRYPEYSGLIDQCRLTGTLLVRAEESYFPCTHPVIGSLMVRNWGLPPMVSQAIRCHHYADVYDLPDQTLPGGAVSLIAATHIAERLAARINGEVDIEVGEELFIRALGHFGIDDDELDGIREAIEQAFAEQS